MSPLGDLYKHQDCLLAIVNRRQFVLTRSPRERYNHTRDIYRWLCSRLWLCEFARFDVSRTERRVNAFLICLDFNVSPPISRQAVRWPKLPSRLTRRRLPACYLWANSRKLLAACLNVRCKCRKFLWIGNVFIVIFYGLSTNLFKMGMKWGRQRHGMSCVWAWWGAWW